MSLQGQIEEMGLGACIQTLSLNRYRGTLRIESDEAGSQFFFISEGEIVLVRQVQRDPVRLGDLLLRAGRITQGDLDQALEQQKSAGKRLGEVLVDMALVTPEEIEKVIKGKFEEEFLDLFLLEKGRFEFIFGLSPETLFAPEEKLERITLNTSGLMLEAMRRIDEWQEMIRSLGNLDTIYRNRVQSMGPDITEYDFKNVTLPADVRTDFYNMLDGTVSVREVLSAAIRERKASRLETFQFLHALVQNELVKPLEFKALLASAKTALEAGDVPAAAKFIRAVIGQKGQVDIGLLKRYLGFLKKHQRPRLAFDEAKLFAAMCLSRDETDNAITLYEEALALEFKNVEVLDRLFYALLRANKRDRAVEVGLNLRDYLASDENLGTAARIVNNLKELAPENAQVLELSGLVLMRQEQNEEAVKELERALEKGGPAFTRRREVVGALLKLRPDRADLRDQAEQLQVQAARAQLDREFKLRVGVLMAILVGIVVVWRGWNELVARRALGQAKAMIAAGLADFDAYNRASHLLGEAVRDGLTTVSREAEGLKGTLEAEWSEKLRAAETERQRAQAERLRAEEARRTEAGKAARRAELDTAFADYRQLVATDNARAATEHALAILAGFKDVDDPRKADLRVFVHVTSSPTGADVLRDGEPVGPTPRSVAVPAGRPSVLALRRRGYRVAEVPVKGDGFEERSTTLEPGPSWRVAQDEPPLPVALGETACVVARGSGKVSALSLADGRPRWTFDAQQHAQGTGTFALLGVAIAGRWAVVLTSQAAVAIELSTGQVEWTQKLEGQEPGGWVVGAKLQAQTVVVVARGTTLVVLDAASGTQVTRGRLPAALTQAPCVAGGRAFALVAGGALVAVDLSRPDAPTLWRKEGLEPRGAALYSELAQAVLVTERERVRSFGAADGAALATLEPQLGPLLGVALSNERVFVLGEGGMLAALRIYDGQLLLRGTRVAPTVSGGPVTVGQDVLVADGKGELLQLTASGRTRQNKLGLGGPVTAPFVSDGAGRVVAVVGNSIVMVEPAEAE